MHDWRAMPCWPSQVVSHTRPPEGSSINHSLLHSDMDQNIWLRLYGLAIGVFVAIGAIVLVGIIIDTTEQPDIGPPRSTISAIQGAVILGVGLRSRAPQAAANAG